MKNKLRKITTTSALALTATLVTGVTPAPASAQVIELLSIAGSALNSLTGGNQQQAQQPPVQNPVNRNWTLGANNLNGNNFHFCLLPCTPQAPRPAVAPQGIPPQGLRPGTPVPPQSVRPPVGAVPVQQNQQVIRNGVPVPPQGVAPQGIPPQGVRPGTPVPPQAQPPAPRPTIVIPPIRLPINLPR